MKGGLAIDRQKIAANGLLWVYFSSAVGGSLEGGFYDVVLCRMLARDRPPKPAGEISHALDVLDLVVTMHRQGSACQARKEIAT